MEADIYRLDQSGLERLSHPENVRLEFRGCMGRTTHHYGSVEQRTHCFVLQNLTEMICQAHDEGL